MNRYQHNDQEAEQNGEGKEIACKCGSHFFLSDREQNWYKEKGLELPKRCKPCRDEKRRQNEQGGNGGRSNSAGYRSKDR